MQQVLAVVDDEPAAWDSLAVDVLLVVHREGLGKQKKKVGGFLAENAENAENATVRWRRKGYGTSPPESREPFFTPPESGRNLKTQPEDPHVDQLALDPTSLVYVIPTSGSTGEPKLVTITNQNLDAFVYATCEETAGKMAKEYRQRRLEGLRGRKPVLPAYRRAILTRYVFDAFWGRTLSCLSILGATVVMSDHPEDLNDGKEWFCDAFGMTNARFNRLELPPVKPLKEKDVLSLDLAKNA